MSRPFSKALVAAIDQSKILGVRAGARAEKYPTPGSVKYVRGFRTPRRRATTLEFVPR